MFDLNEALSDWRKSMVREGVKSSPVLDELESHLREEIRCRVKAGAAEQEAFREALARMGSANTLRDEFDKIDSVSRFLTGAFLLWLGLVGLLAVSRGLRLLDGRAGPLLTLHVLTLTSGYLAAFMAGGIAAAYVCAQWIGDVSATLKRQLAIGTTRFLDLATGLVIVGFVLGLVWSDYRYGRFWIKDVREIGGLAGLTGLVVLSVLRRIQQSNQETQVLLGLGTSLVVGFAWFGMLLVAHNRPPGSWWPMEVFAGIHLFLFALSFVRRQKAAFS